MKPKVAVLLASVVLTANLLADEHQCELYPITLPHALVQNAQGAEVFSEIELGTGPGNYSWLTWDGNNDAPSLANSLLPPGNAELYINPDDAADNQLDIDDWVQGRPGVKNSRAIRDNMDALLGRDIGVPIWQQNRGQGSQFDYQVMYFANIELTDYKLNGKGYISFVYKGIVDCGGIDNTPPVAENLQAEAAQGSSINITVVATDAENDPLTYIIVTFPEHGTLTGDGPNYVYTPEPGYVGEDVFSFVANDGQDNSNIATGSIQVLPLTNNPPVAEDLQLATTENSTTDLTVIASDPDDDPLTYIIIEPPQHGTLSGEGPDYQYTPNTDFTGTDQFSFKVNDGQVDSNIATAQIQVEPIPNQPPVAENLQVTTSENNATDLTVIAFDPEDDPLTYVIVSPPQNGILIGDGPDYQYQPNAGFSGIDEFSFKVNDGVQDSNIATGQIEVTPAANQPPIAESLFVITDEEQSVSFTLVASDPDNDPLTYLIVQPPVNGILLGEGPEYTYFPDDGFFGSETFQFKVNDGTQDSNIAEVTVRVVGFEE